MHLLFRMGKEDGRRNREMGKINLWKLFFRLHILFLASFFCTDHIPPSPRVAAAAMYVSISTTMCSIRFFLIFTVIDILNPSSPSWLSKFFSLNG